MLSLPQGQDRVVTVSLTYDGEAYLPPVGTTFQLVVLKSQTDADIDALFEKTTADGLTLISDNFLSVAVDAADTADLDPGQPYVFEVRAIEPLGVPVIVVAQGRVYISPAPRAVILPPPVYAEPLPFSAAAFQSIRGDTVHLLIFVTLQGAPMSLEGATLFFTLKASLTDADASALLAKQTGAGIEHLDVDGGEATVLLSAAETLGLALDTPFYWDIQFKSDLGEIFTLARGTLVFISHVTVRIV